MRFGVIAAALLLTVGGSAAAQQVEWPREQPPRPLPAKQVKFPPYQIKTLANGLQVIAVSHHEQPAVTVRMIVRAGAAHDPENRPGLATLAASLLDQGTTTKSAEQVAQAIDSIGGVLGTGAGSDLTSITAAVMRDSLSVGLDLVSDVVRNPAFAPEEIERQRQQAVSAMRVSYEDPDYIAAVVFDRLVYGFHPYGKPDSGTPASLAAVTREDLHAFHKRWFGANNAILAIVGDVTAQKAFAEAQRAFGDWSPVEPVTSKMAGVPPPARRVVVIDRPGAVQTEIRVGHVALPRKHKDFLALDLAAKILGGEGGNRLHRVLRSERGLTYGAEATVHAYNESGDIVANTDTRSDTTAEALRLMVDEFARLRREPVSQRELADAQAYLTGSFPLTIETPGAIALQVLNAVFYGLDLEELQTYRERVNRISPADIQRVAQQYLHPDRLSIVLVGDAKVFARQLPAVGFEQVERIPLAELDLTAPDLRRPRTPGTPRGVLMPASYVQEGPAPATGGARALIEKAVRAKGGLQLLRSIRTVKSSYDLVFATPHGDANVTATAYVRYPGQFRIDAQGPDGLRIMTFDNGTAWMSDGNRAAEAPPLETTMLTAGVQRDTVALLLALAEGRVQARDVTPPAGASAGMAALEVDLVPAGRLTMLFDPETGLLLQQRYGGSQGEPLTQESFTDYRNVSGLQVAYRMTVKREGQFPIQRTIRTFEINTPIEATFFRKPESP